VFKESAGKDFMLEAIDILKGVLGFEEMPSKIQEPLFGKDTSPPSPILPRTRRIKPLNSKVELSTTLLPKRPRAPSDPFLDAGASSHSPNGDSILNTAGTDIEEPPSPGAALRETTPAFPAPDDSAFDDEDEQYLRVWLSPDLANQELLQLVKLFPSFITRHQLPRFHMSDIERTKPGTIRFGTGTMWVSSIQRGDGWEGGWWARFVMWWRRIFC